MYNTKVESHLHQRLNSSRAPTQTRFAYMAIEQNTKLALIYSGKRTQIDIILAMAPQNRATFDNRTDHTTYISQDKENTKIYSGHDTTSLYHDPAFFTDALHSFDKSCVQKLDLVLFFSRFEHKISLLLFPQ